MASCDEPSIDVGLSTSREYTDIPSPLGLVSLAKVVPALSLISSTDSRPSPLTESLLDGTPSCKVRLGVPQRIEHIGNLKHLLNEYQSGLVTGRAL